MTTQRTTAHGTGAHGPGADRGPAWVATAHTRNEARLRAARRLPLVTLRARLRRRRGLSRRFAVPTSADEILGRLSDLPLSVWTYGFDDPSVRHLGPMAQDFGRAFGLGDSDRRIDPIDANGVLMASCQALHRRLVALEAEVAELRNPERSRAAADGPP